MKNKLKVSTNYRDAQIKKDKITKILKEYPEGLFPKWIALYTRINVNTVKSILPKMDNVRQKEGYRGIYVLVENNSHGSIFDWKIHNITLVCDLNHYNGEKIDKTIISDTVKFQFGIGKNTKKAHMHLATNYPIEISSLNIYCLYFLEMIKDYYNYSLDTSNIIVNSIEFNKDYLNLRIDGLNSITFTSLAYQYKIYQKKQGLRQEHKINCPVGVPEIFSMLQSGNHTLDIYSELNNIKKNIELLIDNDRNLYRMFYSSLNKNQEVKNGTVR